MTLLTLAALLVVGGAVPVAHAQAFDTLHSFYDTGGSSPYAAVIQGKDGALYGTTYQGGSFMEGTVFRLALTVQIASVSIAPASVIGGQQNPTGTVALSGPAPTGGKVPANVTTRITAVYNGSRQSTVLTVIP